ncbi:MAG: hypothetical protein M5R36_05535 [Deltaproteobacteria bacterium]|nr:hypothetical protein [Deltaproteobacteria bacterium]
MRVLIIDLANILLKFGSNFPHVMPEAGDVGPLGAIKRFGVFGGQFRGAAKVLAEIVFSSVF